MFLAGLLVALLVCKLRQLEGCATLLTREPHHAELDLLHENGQSHPLRACLLKRGCEQAKLTDCRLNENRSEHNARPQRPSKVSLGANPKLHMGQQRLCM